MPKYVGRFESTKDAVKPQTFTRSEFYGFLFFYLSVIVKDIYRSKSGNTSSQIIMNSTTNYFIY